MDARDLFVGVDPGFHGAIAVLSLQDGACAVCPHIFEIHDMPTLPVPYRGKTRRELDPHRLVAILRPLASRVRVAVLERPTASPQMGVTSAFRFGAAVESAQVVLASLGIPFRAVVPSTWKALMRLPADKLLALAKVREWFSDDPGLHRIRRHDHAEAAALALMGFERFYDAPRAPTP